MTPKTVGSLCTGAAGLDMAVCEVFDAQPVWHAENDSAAARVLAYRFPGVPNLGDLTSVDWSRVEPVDVFTAGYPCQPDSLAGKGLSEDDHRWIWPDIARAIGVLRPRIVVLENVPGHFVRGFRTVLGSLTDLGYDTQWTLVRASDVGAPHRRERLFVVAADAQDERHEWPRRSRRWWTGPADSGGRPTTDASGNGRDRDAQLDSAAHAWVGGEHRGHADGRDDGTDWGAYTRAIRRWERTLGRDAPAPTEPGTRGGQRLSPTFVEWLMGWPAGWVTGVPGISRSDQLKICGNGVVPQQAAAALRLLISVDASLEVPA